MASMVKVHVKAEALNDLQQAADYLREREVAYRRNVPKMSKLFARHAGAIESFIEKVNSYAETEPAEDDE